MSRAVSSSRACHLEGIQIKASSARCILRRSGISKPSEAPRGLFIFCDIFIAPYMREYGDSTPFTDEELERYHSSDPEDQEATLCVECLELAEFMAHFIRFEHLPAPRESNGVKSGGIHIFTWSTGSVPALALLANLEALDKDLSNLLEEYMGTIFIADLPSMCYGIPEPAKLYHPFRDTSLSHEETFEQMLFFVFTYFEPFEDLASVTPSSIEARKTLAEVSPEAKITKTTFSLGELEGLTNRQVSDRIGLGLVEWVVYAENVRRALLDTKGIWKNVKVVLGWGSMSFWSTAWGAKSVAELLEMPVPEGIQRRDVQIVRLDGANHMFIYDRPQQTVQFIVEKMH
ncbi:hypothetical protein BDY19DRAFT_990898 [Irpex rosettiformis]|uniref:Uncharacterized protein n=1 Tax=Irpex rosettiformis TaxID=378272 RepID=A0ACB8UCU1_9APHY|nr:hypothetical protein BDY19DRAFT_990898 [Irpex rosettiformis]